VTEKIILIRIQLLLIPTYDQAESCDQSIKGNSNPNDMVVRLEVPVKNVALKSFKSVMFVTLFLLDKELAKDM